MTVWIRYGREHDRVGNTKLNQGLLIIHNPWLNAASLTISFAFEMPDAFLYCLRASEGWILPASGEVAGGGGGQLSPQRALQRGCQNDDRGAPAAKQIIRIAFNYSIV